MPLNEQCMQCGTTDSRHAAHGLCNRCWFRNRRKAAS